MADLKMIYFLFLLFLVIVVVSGCNSNKYVCPDNTVVSDPSSCPKTNSVKINSGECKYSYDCGDLSTLRCLSNHCIAKDSYEKAREANIGQKEVVRSCSFSSAECPGNGVSFVPYSDGISHTFKCEENQCIVDRTFVAECNSVTFCGNDYTCEAGFCVPEHKPTNTKPG